MLQFCVTVTNNESDVFKTQVVFLIRSFQYVYIRIFIFICGNRLLCEHTLIEWPNEESKTNQNYSNHHLKNPFGKILCTFFLFLFCCCCYFEGAHIHSRKRQRGLLVVKPNRNTLLSSLIALTSVFSFTLSVMKCVRMESTLIKTDPRFLFLPTKK